MLNFLEPMIEDISEAMTEAQIVADSIFRCECKDELLEKVEHLKELMEEIEAHSQDIPKEFEFYADDLA